MPPLGLSRIPAASSVSLWSTIAAIVFVSGNAGDLSRALRPVDVWLDLGERGQHRAQRGHLLVGRLRAGGNRTGYMPELARRDLFGRGGLVAGEHNDLPERRP